ncbi:unnamed protein product, partial [Staurois parvus]
MDRGTGKIGYLSNSGQQSSCPQSLVISCKGHPCCPHLWSSLCCPQSLTAVRSLWSSPVLSAVCHPCAVRSLWSSLCCPQSLVIPVLSAVSGHLLCRSLCH